MKNTSNPNKNIPSEKSSYYAIYMQMNLKELTLHLQSPSQNSTPKTIVMANIDERIAAAVSKNNELNKKLGNNSRHVVEDSINDLIDSLVLDDKKSGFGVK